MGGINIGRRVANEYKTSITPMIEHYMRTRFPQLAEPNIIPIIQEYQNNGNMWKWAIARGAYKLVPRKGWTLESYEQVNRFKLEKDFGLRMIYKILLKALKDEWSMSYDIYLKGKRKREAKKELKRNKRLKN